MGTGIALQELWLLCTRNSQQLFCHQRVMSVISIPSLQRGECKDRRFKLLFPKLAVRFLGFSMAKHCERCQVHSTLLKPLHSSEGSIQNLHLLVAS